jgi:hypothetical protein
LRNYDETLTGDLVLPRGLQDRSSVPPILTAGRIDPWGIYP